MSVVRASSESGAPRGKRGRVDLDLRHERLEVRWASAITSEAWRVYRGAMKVLRDLGVDFMIGGGFAMATFTGRWRDTKDVDFYILPQERSRVIPALLAAGYDDLFPQLAYDRNWIYRSTRNGMIVDCIWAMANQRAQVNETWFDRADRVTLRDENLKLLSLEHFLWCKIYIIQRDHCDWTDIFNVLYVSGPFIDWEYLRELVGEDLPLLRGVMSVFSWLCPGHAAELPGEIWTTLGLPQPTEIGERMAEQRIRWLDSRQWFSALIPVGSKLEI